MTTASIDRQGGRRLGKDLELDAVESKKYPDYLVTRDGRIFSIKRFGPARPLSAPYNGRVIKELSYHCSGVKRYLEVSLVKDGKKYIVRVHKLVAEVYLPEKPFKEAVVRHLDGDSFNNWDLNLAWGSRKDDANDRVMLGTTAKGERNGSSKLTEEIVREMRERYGNGETTAKVAEEFFISQRQARNVIFGHSWKHV